MLSALLLATAPSAFAATILEKTLTVRLSPPARSVEQGHLRVRMETAADVDAWSTYPIYLDDNRTLKQAAAFAEHPDGSRTQVRRKQRDTAEISGSSFHDSGRYELLSFKGLGVGSEIDVTWEVEVAPYYPAGRTALVAGEPIARLAVDVAGGGEDWRWRIAGPADGLEIEERPGGVRVTGRDLEPVEPPDYAPESAGTAILHYAWSEPTWAAVGSWYEGLLTEVPRAGDDVKRQARDLVAGLDAPRDRLEALLAFARRQVRYVAVEVGIGGYRPSPPSEVLNRKWGDCKDKSVLLVDMLREAGIEAHPALIRSARWGRIEAGFPTAYEFNHMIVAVPSAAVAASDDDPVNDGFFFLDPTQTHGKAGWLHPGVQDQDALVIRPGGSHLARTPLRPRLEHRSLIVDLEVAADGSARGAAALEISGRRATGFLVQAASQPPERTEEDARAIFAGLLPGVTVERLGWTMKADDSVPKVSMSAAVRIDSLVRGLDSSAPSFALAGLSSMPEPSVLADRELDVVAPAQSASLVWHMTLPAGWCRPQEKERGVANPVGTFHQRILHGATPESFVIERRTELAQRWIEPADFADLKALALAEHRAQKRRVRLACRD